MKNLYILFFFLSYGIINAQIVHIPDPNFKAALLIPGAGIDTNNDGEIQVSEAEAADRINAMGHNIVSLEGLQYFINIKMLSVDDNQIAVLDVSHNTKLERIFCYQNLITSLDFSHNSYLNWIDAGDNPLSTLNVSGNPLLEVLSAFSCELTELDVSNNPRLEFLDIYDNQIETLDLSNNPEIFALYANDNNLKSLDIKNGNNHLFDIMHVYGNPNLSCIQVDDVDDAISRICDMPNKGWCKDETASYSEDCQLGTGELTKLEFQLFPNPAGNFLSIKSKGNIENLKIYSSSGILIKEGSSENIDVSQLSAGMYFVKVESDGRFNTKKFIKE